MINKTIQKIKDYADVLASIMKSFATIIASTIACITAGITGYIEIKKLTVVALKTRKETKNELKALRSEQPRPAPPSRSGASTNSPEREHPVVTPNSESLATTARAGSTLSVAPSPEEANYQITTNTFILMFAILILPTIWYFDRKKKTNESNRKN